MKKTFVKSIYDRNPVDLPAAPAGKRWYFVEQNPIYVENRVYVTYNLAPVVSLYGVEAQDEKTRKVFVKVKNTLKGWGHEETKETVRNAAEYLWEVKKITGENMIDLMGMVDDADAGWYDLVKL